MRPATKASRPASTPFFIALFLVLLAVTYIPALSLWLPRLVLGN